MRARYYLLIIIVFLATGGANSQEESGTVKIWKVGPERVPCTGVTPQLCLQIKENESDNYTRFYGTIGGFCYEPGFEYQVRVRGTPVARPPADASSMQWTLLELINKTGDKTASELEGVSWSLDSYLDQEGLMVCAIPESRPNILFQDGNVTGWSGCNRYFGRYSTDGSDLTVSNLGATLMFCPGETMAQERAYTDRLQKAASFNVSGNLLRIKDENGNTTLVFSVYQSPDLTGRTWDMTFYNNGRQALVSPLAGTQVTATFGEDGRLTGSAGCNNYTASYEINGSSIKISPAATTRKYCPMPEGIMHQEMQYLAALQSASRYSIQESDLILFDLNGTRAVTFRESRET